MLPSKTTRLALGIGLCACGLLFAASASATPQFTPTSTQFLHTPLSGEPGAEWNTGGVGGPAQLSYDAGSGILTITGFVDVLNYYDTASGSGCETDSGSNCSLNYTQDLGFVLTASFLSVDPVEELIPGVLYKLTFNFGTDPYAGTSDLTVSDPADGGSTQLTADVVGGLYNGDAISGLIASVTYNVLTGAATTNVIQGAGILDVTGGNQSSLFGSGVDTFGLSLAAIDNFDDGLGGGLSEIVTVAYNTGSLPDFTAEGSGQIYRIVAGNFVIPEPGTALLVGLGVAILGLARRRARG